MRIATNDPTVIAPSTGLSAPAPGTESDIAGVGADKQPRDPATGKFKAPTRAMGPDDWGFSEAPGFIDPENDPLFVKTDAKDAAEFAGTEAPAAAAEAHPDQDDGAAALGGEAGLDPAPSERPGDPSKTPDDDAFLKTLRAMKAKNPALAAKMAEEWAGVSTAPAASDQNTNKPATQANSDAALEATIADAIARGDAKAVIAAIDARALEKVQPLADRMAAADAYAQKVAEKQKQFDAFEKANPGWQVHRAAMLRALDKIAAVSKDTAEAIDPTTLLGIVAPGFKPTSTAAAAKKVADGKAAAASSQMNPPASSRSGGAPTRATGQRSSDPQQAVIDRTVDRLAREHAVRNFI